MPRKAKKTAEKDSNTLSAEEQDSQWDTFYTRLFDFYVENQHTNVQPSDDAKLAGWCKEQRASNNSLTDMQRKRLDFMKFFAASAAAPQRPNRPVLPPPGVADPTLAAPAAALAAAAETDNVDGPDKIQKRGAKAPITDEKSWVERYTQFSDFLDKDIEEYPRQEVSESDWNPIIGRVGKVDPGLKEWVKYQKDLYTGRIQEKRPEDALSKERVELMERLKFDWNISGHNSWIESYNKLVKLKEEIGHVDISQNHNYRRLGGWVHYQRRLYSRGEMSEERIAKLEEIGFVWRKKGVVETWMTRYNQLVEYGKKHGHVDVPKKNPDLGGMQLGRFVLEQRKQWALYQKLQQDPDFVTRKRKELKKQGAKTMLKKCNMTAERIEMLERIGFKWRIRDPRPRRKNVGANTKGLENSSPVKGERKKRARTPTTRTSAQHEETDENAKVNADEASVVDVGGDDGGYYDDGGNDEEVEGGHSDNDHNGMQGTSLREQRAMLELRKQQIDSQTAALEAEAATARRIADEAEAKLARIRQKAQRVAAQLREIDQADPQAHDQQHRTNHDHQRYVEQPSTNNSQLDHLLEATRKRSATAMTMPVAGQPNPLLQQPQQPPPQEVPLQQQQLYQQQQWLLGNWKRPRYFMS